VIRRTPGDGRYARVEREQRWVLGALPDGIEDPVDISDRYLTHSTLRLRQMKSESGTVRKLGQKVRLNPESPEAVKMTNLYLNEEEFALFADLVGAPLLKTRWRWSVDEQILTVDQFAGDLDGLVLAEIELTPDGPYLDPPALAIADVTHDDRFSGGNLAHLSRVEAVHLLAQVTEMKIIPKIDDPS